MSKYSIGEFARMIGINAQTPRYYEKIGLIQSKKQENRYRYYSDVDCRRVLESRLHSSLGFTLKEMQQRFRCSSVKLPDQIFNACL
jgi:DNA-binding transcriptional MerR regulator